MRSWMGVARERLPGGDGSWGFAAVALASGGCVDAEGAVPVGVVGAQARGEGRVGGGARGVAGAQASAGGPER